MVYIHGYGRRQSLEDILWLRKHAREKARLRLHQKGKIKARAEEVEECIAEQALLNQALLRLCLEKGIFSRDEFAGLLRDIDLLDGVADGKLDMPKVKAERKKAKEAREKAGGKSTTSPRPKIRKRRS